MHTVRVTRNNSLVHDVVVEGLGFVRRSPVEFSFFEFKGVVDAFPVPQKNNNVNNHLSKSSVTPSCFRNKVFSQFVWLPQHHHFLLLSLYQP